MYRKLKLDIVNSIKDAINTLDWEVPDNIPVEEPPNAKMGDLASSVAFELAGKLKKSPVEIAQDILKVFIKPDNFSQVESKGPYLNFFIDYQKFSKLVLNSINEGYGNLESKNRKIILEHTSANPNGPLHIGHIRNSIIGDSLNRVLMRAGYSVETQYYVNDMGRQIAMVVWGLLNLKFDEKTPETSYKEQINYDPYLWAEQILKNRPELDALDETYVDALKNILYLQVLVDENQKDHQIGKLYFRVNQELKARPELIDEISQLLITYEEGEDPLLEFIFKEAVNSCLEGMEPTLKRLHVNHDSFIWESKFVRDGSVEKVIEKLKDSGYTKDNEVLYLDLKEFGIEKELVLMRSDGTSLYSTRDLAYHLEKSRKGDVVIDILGSDHKLAISQIRLALGFLEGKSPEVIFYEFITLPEGSMSTRRGVFISVDQLMTEAVERAKAEIKKRRTDLDRTEIAEIAEKIGIGAIRYYIARLSPEKHMVFKWDEALSFERGCASIQYAHARACKLLQKAEKFDATIDLENILDHYQLENSEMELIKTISQFTSVIEESAQTRKVHKIAQYSLDLASAFNKFYKSLPVIGSEEEILRLFLVDKSRITIKNCLDLLGIEAPESM